jgi:hypothetical protein
VTAITFVSQLQIKKGRVCVQPRRRMCVRAAEDSNNAHGLILKAMWDKMTVKNRRNVWA